jgi:metallo-beta-lactamase family protein
MKLTFLGATNTVTGSKYLLEAGGLRILIDCGLFQGLKMLRLRNWAKLPIRPDSIDRVIITHAHIDHTGYLPLLVKNGFRGKVYSTFATRDLCEIMLPDSAHLQEEEARFANKHGFSKHEPALPLYTREDAYDALTLFEPVDFNHPIKLNDSVDITFIPNGHILGSACVKINDQQRTITFSGDVGRPHQRLMKAPQPLRETDYLVVESTYGDRLHDLSDPIDQIASIIERTIARGGKVLIPVFAVGRAQDVLYDIYLLKKAGRIPDVPVYLNSPMAIDATEIFQRHQGEHRLSHAECESMCHSARMVNSVEESIALNENPKPMIILAASGMATGGRVIHHLKNLAPNPRNSILFVGFQAAGTRGDAMIHGAKEIKIHGEYIPIHAQVELVSNMSAHADYQEMLTWLGEMTHAPRQTFVTHGEPLAADAMRRHLQETLHWNAHVPDYLETIELT